jgi:hypothetical protein
MRWCRLRSSAITLSEACERLILKWQGLFFFVEVGTLAGETRSVRGPCMRGLSLALNGILSANSINPWQRLLHNDNRLTTVASRP